ncbi:MAG: glycosyltransferase family 4 protein [Clostridiales bacterium]|nr:glycosyltransferase family 4 protein [Clostridiales bacterium]
MRIAAVLPHVEVFGGVRRYIEIGNELIKRGHDYTLFTPAGEKPPWLEFKGACRPFEALNEETGFHIGLCSEYSILPYFDRLDAKAKFFYFVLEGHKREKEVVKRGYVFLGSSEGISRRMERKYKIRCLRAPGGVNPGIFYPWPRTERQNDQPEASQEPLGQQEFKILSYGRIYKKRKGVHHVIKAAEKLHRQFPGIRLILFDSLVGAEKHDPRSLIKTAIPHEFHLNLPQSRMAWLFAQADLFASAEKRAGWANTAAEAMACRLPVVCTASGAQDFAFHEKTALIVPFAHSFFIYRQIKRLILDSGLRRYLAEAGYEKIKEFTWEALAKRLEAFFSSVLR